MAVSATRRSLASPRLLLLLSLLQLVLVALLAQPAAAAPPPREPLQERGASDGGAVWATPHDSYSSSVGVLGCKINTNRVAYWPGAVDCTNLCISLTYEDRQLYLLRIDTSGGAHDISYDAWNYLYTGHSATDKPVSGGGVPMQYETVDPSKCSKLIRTDGGKLPLSASNSMNFLSSCLNQTGSWVADNYLLYNIVDSVCAWGRDEECTLDWPNANQPKCSHQLGLTVKYTGAPVFNIRYPTGDKVRAVSDSSAPDTTSPDQDSGAAAATQYAPLRQPSSVMVMVPPVMAMVSNGGWAQPAAWALFVCGLVIGWLT
ncbi:hypothetical protein PLIIFM63780_006586 [Purpureocillium lilacinum]|uniref:uncharacterized protein n=1 Tax=Purpureocillium lilacinum TaxID=33203 RepID=UPI002084575C|nr:hypothetical protein PLICBS_006600 [Purpureocillium lilacinum]GJN83040.1 hypothetical protein PLIIFM63780_006586 [Purpureocillium lilacinum]